MRANTLLPPQVASRLEADARQRSTNGPVNIRFQAIIENGYSTGYEMLHGTDLLAGGFTIKGKAIVAHDLCGRKAVGYVITLTWNDFIDPNPQEYKDDEYLANFFSTFFSVADYTVHLSWDAAPVIYFDASGNIARETGYPFSHTNHRQ